MFWAAATYIAALAAYHARLSDRAPSKALVAWRWVVRLARDPARVLRAPLAADDRLALLCCLLKAFFAPMMVMSMMIFCVGAVGNALALAFGSEPGEGWLRGRSFWLLLHLILFVDVLVFTFGYLVELPRLGNQIRSVDPSPIGWAVALVCYPPFNSVTAYVYGSTASDFPQFDDPTAHALGNALLLAMMALYAWASVALGWKGSNLTHRGIVASITTAALPAPTAQQLDPRALARLREGNYELLQLDATAYPGNSGGPLLDAASGRVLGIVNMVLVKAGRESALSSPTGITYAVPVRHLHELMKSAAPR